MIGTWLKVFCDGNDCSLIFEVSFIFLTLLWLFSCYKTYKNYKKNKLAEIFNKWETSLFNILFPIIIILIFLSQ